ncbi:hypothetical protein C8R47DRAFT_1152247 [Mycena vitilis]|nr:hypothetical protein C8R47DRAFT_1152247 [Mycena vitilis]
MILSCWEPGESEALPWAVLDYINCRKSDIAIIWLASGLSENAWKALPQSIYAETYQRLGSDMPVDCVTSALTAVWRLCQSYFDGSTNTPDQSFFDELIDSVSQTNVPSITPSVTAVVKSRSFRGMAFKAWDMHQGDIMSSFRSRHFPTQTSIPTPTTEEVDGEGLEQLKTHVLHRGVEAELVTLCEFIECCVSGDLPYKAVGTVTGIVRFSIQSAIHSVHQIRFSRAIQDLLNASMDSAERAELLQQILILPVFGIYAPNNSPNPSPYASTRAWLDNSDARDALRTTLASYLPALSSTGKEVKLCLQVKEIMANLDALHPQDAERAKDTTVVSNSDQKSRVQS